MLHSWLRKALEEYAPEQGTYEPTYRMLMLNLLEKEERCLYRDHFSPGHFTAGTWVVNPSRTRVLLLHHPHLACWIQPGGHADGEANLLEVALRELEEETGYTRDMLHLPQGNGIFQVDIHLVPAREKNGRLEPEHCHHDIRFLVEIDDTLPVPGSEENLNVRWFGVDEAGTFFTPGHGMWHMLNKTAASLG